MSFGSLHRIGVDFARLTNLADGIFAVAMTFLAFSIQLPLPDATPDGGLAHKLHTLLPQLGALTITYFLSARFWLLHCDMHRLIVHGGPVLLYLNLLFLFAVVLLPFSTDMLGTFPLGTLDAGVYAGNLAMLAVLFWAIWHYAVRHPACLVSPESLTEARVARSVAAVFAVVFLGSVVVAQFRPELALVILVATPVSHGPIRYLVRGMEPG